MPRKRTQSRKLIAAKRGEAPGRGSAKHRKMGELAKRRRIAIKKQARAVSMRPKPVASSMSRGPRTNIGGRAYGINRATREALKPIQRRETARKKAMSKAMTRRGKVEQAQQPPSQATKQARGRIPPKPKKQLGPPKVGMRSVIGRKGGPVTIRRPGKRSV